MLTIYFRLSAIGVWFDLKHARWTLKQIPVWHDDFASMFIYIENRQSEYKFLTTN